MNISISLSASNSFFAGRAEEESEEADEGKVEDCRWEEDTDGENEDCNNEDCNNEDCNNEDCNVPGSPVEANSRSLGL